MGKTAKPRTADGSVEDAAERLEQALHEKSERLNALVRMTTAVVSAEDLDAVLQVVVFEMGRFFSVDYVAVAAVERAKGVYRVEASAGKGGVGEQPEAERPLSDVRAVPLAGSAVDAVASGREALVLPALDTAGGEFPEEAHLARRGMRACVFVPMVGRGGVVGALILASAAPQEYSRDDLHFAELVAEQLAGAVERRGLLRRLRKEHGKMAIMHEIGRMAMSQFDLVDLLDSVTGSIQRYFGYYDVSMFLVDDEAGDVVMMAQAGAYREMTSVGYRQKIGLGLVGQCAGSGETIVVNDVSGEPRRIVAFPGEVVEGSELCVPVRAGDNVLGVVAIECTDVGAFEEEDVSAIETIASQIAQAIENARLYEETRLLKEFNESVLDNMPAALVVLDADLRVRTANDAFCELRRRGRDELVGKEISELFAPAFLREGGLARTLRGVLDGEEPVAIRDVKGVLAPAPDRLFNMYVAAVGIGAQQSAMVMLEDVTQSVEHAYQLSMLRQINEAVQTTLDLKRLLRLVLTCTTSGHALGFNRAILLMVNKGTNALEGRLAIGPKDQEDAYRIWQRIDAESKTFKELLRDADDGRPDEEMALYHVAARLHFPLDSDELVVRAVHDKQVIVVEDAHSDERVGEEFRSIVGANSFVCVPLVSKDEAVGAIVADNLYSGEPITPEQVELLTIFANHVGLAIENAEAYDALHKQIGKLQAAYRELRETQGKLVQSEKLAAIGEVAAHVAHEIRNPLVTIGGFARRIQRGCAPDDPGTRSVDIIIGEVARLEKILANVMDFSKPSAPWKRPTKINQIVENTCVLLTEELESRSIGLTQELHPELPLLMVDAEQIKQALLNILKNAMESIDTDGRITVATRPGDDRVRIDVADTGKGIPEEMIPSLFDPFFTMRPDGTGLGLAVTRKIIVDHGGDVEVRSRLGIGTTFTVSLPAQAARPAGGSKPSQRRTDRVRNSDTPGGTE